MPLRPTVRLRVDELVRKQLPEVVVEWQSEGEKPRVLFTVPTDAIKRRVKGCLDRTATTREFEMEFVVLDEAQSANLLETMNDAFQELPAVK